MNINKYIFFFLLLVIGKDARNLRILKEKVRDSLIKYFKKDFDIRISIRVRKGTLYDENEKMDEITSPELEERE